MNIRKSVTIEKSAAISAGSVQNAGTVMGTLSVQSQSLENTGSTGTFEVKSDGFPGYTTDMAVFPCCIPANHWEGSL